MVTIHINITGKREDRHKKKKDKNKKKKQNKTKTKNKKETKEKHYWSTNNGHQIITNITRDVPPFI